MKRVVLCSLICVSQLFAVPSLSTFSYGGAWVMPVVHDGLYEWFLLGREAGGKDSGTYDAFGGSKEIEDRHPVETAAREFHEEAILSRTLGMSFFETQSYIDLGTGNTVFILALTDTKYRHNNVVYVTHLSDQNSTKIIGSFAGARSTARIWAEKEKDALARVKRTDLEQAINTSKRNSGVYVSAEVTDLKGRTSTEKIHVRPILVRLIRPWLTHAPFTQGVDMRIHFYTVS